MDKYAKIIGRGYLVMCEKSNTVVGFYIDTREQVQEYLNKENEVYHESYYIEGYSIPVYSVPKKDEE